MNTSRLCSVFAGLVLGACAQLAYSQASTAKVPPPAAGPDELHALWTANVSPILKGPIPTTSQGAYYDGEMLLVPVHAAFMQKEAAWQQEFSDHFARMMQARSSLTDVDLSRLQYEYLASEFIVLASRSGKSNLIPPGLPEFLFTDIKSLWQEKPAWQWDHPAFPGGVRERTLWKLSNKNVAKSYYRAILDTDFFLFAVAADLRAYGGLDQQPDRHAVLSDILDITNRVCRQEIKLTDVDGWLLQPGVWADHPDFKYAGHSNPGQGMVPVPLRDVSWDSSHFMRWPPFILSLMKAYPEGSVEHHYYVDLRDGLNRQFFRKVVVPPSAEFPCYRTNNYMDGRNGLYRWGYANLGDSGYVAYKTSGALLIGWWAFLDTDDSRTMYRKIADEFPWPQECVYLYLGPIPAGHTYEKTESDPNSAAMKFRYLIARLASEI